jgi:hypothetical protein
MLTFDAHNFFKPKNFELKMFFFQLTCNAIFLNNILFNADCLPPGCAAANRASMLQRQLYKRLGRPTRFYAASGLTAWCCQ